MGARTSVDTSVQSIQTEHVTLNLGPQHPSTHGVFRMILTLDGEIVVDAEWVFGYLHRGVEKLCEEGTYLQNITFTDRMDYLASMFGNWSLSMATEDLLGIQVPERGEYLRVIAYELSRIASHCMAYGAFANDVGTWFTPIVYAFREREKFLDLFEMMCGARMTFSYVRPGGVSRDVDDDFVARTKALMKQMPGFIDEYEALLTDNEIFLARTKGIGTLPKDMAISYSVSGPALRGSGVQYDVRKAVPYSVYDRFQFDIPVGTNGDAFDRYKVRIEEMRQSVRIVEQALDGIPGGPTSVEVPRNVRPPVGEAFSRVESARGELGFYLVSDGSVAPYRCHARAPSFINLGVLKPLLKGVKVADMIIVFGSIDIVLGEVDR